MAGQQDNVIIVHEIEELTLRAVFAREDTAFTPWLAAEENIGRLSRTLGFDLEVEGTEVSTGTFRTDILARRLNDGAKVVIENQFGRSDHDHFGKLLTYLAAHDASVVIWLAEAFADEHRASLTWLNDHTDETFEFWGVVPKLLRIANSPPGLRFDVVIAPNRLVKEVRRSERTIDESVSVTREAFWTAFSAVTAEDPVLSRCSTRYGGRLGFLWMFSEAVGVHAAAEPHLLVFLTMSPPTVGFCVECKKEAHDEAKSLAASAFSLALERLRLGGIAPDHVRDGDVRFAGDMSNSESIAALAGLAAARARAFMEALSSTFLHRQGASQGGDGVG